MRIGFSATYGFKSIYEAVDYAIVNGFNSVEINLNIPEFYPSRYNEYDRRSLKALMEEKNFNITFHAPEDINLSSMQQRINDASLSILDECIDFASELGGKRFTFHLGDSVNFTMVDRNLRMEDWYLKEYESIIENNLSEIIKYGKGRIVLCAENSGYLSNVKTAALESSLNNGLYLTWDIGHAFLQKNQMDFMIKNINSVRNVHLHDVYHGRDHSIIGTGDIDIPKYINMLSGKDVMYVIEVRPHSAAVESLNNLKGILQEKCQKGDNVWN